MVSLHTIETLTVTIPFVEKGKFTSAPRPFSTPTLFFCALLSCCLLLCIMSYNSNDTFSEMPQIVIIQTNYTTAYLLPRAITLLYYFLLSISYLNILLSFYLLVDIKTTTKLSWQGPEMQQCITKLELTIRLRMAVGGGRGSPEWPWEMGLKDELKTWLSKEVRNCQEVHTGCKSYQTGSG